VRGGPGALAKQVHVGEGEGEAAVDQAEAGLEVASAGDPGIIAVVRAEAVGQAHPGEVEAEPVEAGSDELGVAEVQASADGGPVPEWFEGPARVERTILVLQAQVDQALDLDAEMDRGEHERREGAEGGGPLAGAGVPLRTQGDAQGRRRVGAVGARRDGAEGGVGDELEAQASAVLVQPARLAEEGPVVIAGAACGQPGVGQRELDPAAGAADLDAQRGAEGRAQRGVAEQLGEQAELAQERGQVEVAKAEGEGQGALALGQRERGGAEGEAESRRGRVGLARVGWRSTEGLPARRRGVRGHRARVVAGVEVAPHLLARDGVGRGGDPPLGQLERAIDVGPGEASRGGGIEELIAEAVEEGHLAAIEVGREEAAGEVPGERLVGGAQRGADDGVEAEEVVLVAARGGEGRAPGGVVALAVGVGEEGVELLPGALAAGLDGAGERGEPGEALGAQREVGLEATERGVVAGDVGGAPGPRRRPGGAERPPEVGGEVGRLSGAELPREQAPLAGAEAGEDAVDLGPLGVDPPLDRHQRDEVVVAEGREVKVDVGADLGDGATLIEVVAAVDLGEAVGREIEGPDDAGEVGGEVTRVDGVGDAEEAVDLGPLGVGIGAAADQRHECTKLVVLEEEPLAGEAQERGEAEHEAAVDRRAAPRRHGVAGARGAEGDGEGAVEGLVGAEAAVLADVGDAGDPAVDVDRSQGVDAGPTDDQLALGPVDPRGAAAVAAGLERGAGGRHAAR
jgi:hypothetical protein